MSTKTILFLAANPSTTSRLRLNVELREIDAALRRAKYRERFILKQRTAVRPRDLQLAILECQPDIVHFSGHGTGKEGLLFEDDSGTQQLVTGEALARLFGMFAERIECVLLNACYSAYQAEAIAQHINYVIGMDESIGDNAAIKFAQGFYDALAAYEPELYAGSPVEFAFNFARVALGFINTPQYQIPKLIKKPEIILAEWFATRKIRDKSIPFEETLREELVSNRTYKAAKAYGDKAILFPPEVKKELEELESLRVFKKAKASRGKVISFEQILLEELESLRVFKTTTASREKLIPFEQVTVEIGKEA